MRRRHTYRRLIGMRLGIVTVAVIFYSWFLASTNSTRNGLFDASTQGSNFTKLLIGRKLLSELYPPEVLSEDDLESGGIILHMFGVMYMFCALAIVCDEFFVPALEVIIDKLDLTPDVAGATFMAAGGSAPELFTSLIGTFISKNDVGIGTIVGSAVFNILFVIGMCSFCSLTVLTLTWWPLFRDVCFYSFSLIFLILFFKDSEIETWESVVLFACYIAYVIFMKFNPAIEHSVHRCLHRCFPSKYPSRANSTDFALGSARSHRKSVVQIAMKSHHTADHRSPQVEKSRSHEASSQNTSSTVANSAHQIVQDQVNNSNDTNSKVSRSESYDMESLRKSGKSMSSRASTSRSSQKKEPSLADAPIAEVNGSSVKSFEEEDSDTAPEIELPTAAASEEIEQPHYFKVLDVEDEDEEEAKPLDMSFPEDIKDRVKYIFLFPILFPLWVTTPDVRKDNRRNCFIITFIFSIMWIAVFSFLMVWWSNTVGETIGLPAEIIGIVVLAAGTSVPDLITSVIVAKKGLGDMAVSSSVGSNIFDITVGLPVPWLLKSIVTGGENYDVESKGLFCSIVLLFLMLIAVVTSIAVSGWKMKKILGVVMMCLYVVFVAMSVLLTKEIISCGSIQSGLGV